MHYFQKTLDAKDPILVVLAKKIVNAFSQKTLLDPQQIIEDLLAMRKMFQILSHEDQSHNPEFTQQLSEIWLNILHNSEYGEQLCHSIAHTKLSTFIDKINHFPPTEELSLGHYLKEYAGREWLPFSFMDILHQLFQQHQENPLISELNEWIFQLNDIASSFDEKIEVD